MLQIYQEKSGFLVSFCGDGANDCSALKMADAGISLSQAEASIAAPFTSNIPDIRAVVEVLRQGRAALSTSLQSFKYLCYYSLIQSFGLVALYYRNIDYSNGQYIWMDLFTAFPLSLIMCRHGAYFKLTQHVPGDSLLNFSVLISVFGQLAFGLGFIIFGMWYVTRYSVYKDPKDLNPDFEDSTAYFESTIIFLANNMMNIISAMAFTVGKPFREPMYKNIPMMVFCVLHLMVTTYFTFEQYIVSHIHWLKTPTDWAKGLILVSSY